MTMDNKIDYSTLNWVKGEIDETLNHARQALEAFVENPEDATQLRFCATHLHQVNGTLQMVELYGAALLAEEMEGLIHALLDGGVGQPDEGYEVLMRGILQLPDYLERVQDGMLDDPLVLLPLLNDLRAARGEHLLSENVLFAPALADAGSVVIDDVGTGGGEPMDVKALKTLRHQFQLGLLGWIRDRDPEGSLRQIADVVARIEASVRGNDARRLWWVASGVLEALLEHGIEAGVSVKKLVGQLDREIKRLIDGGEAGPADDELLRNLLYYVAAARGKTPRVSAVKEKFKLSGALPSADDVATAREQLAGPNAAMMQSVADAIREDLAAVKDALDLFLRSEQSPLQDLEAQTLVLRKVADTLGMLGLGMPRRIVQEQAAVIAKMLSSEAEPSEAALLEIAGALLYVESSLHGLVAQRGDADRGTAEDEPTAQMSFPPAELEQINRAVLREVTTGLGAVKDAIVSFIDSPWDHHQLADVPATFDQVRGAVQMLGMERIGGLLGSLRDYIGDRLVARLERPEQHELEALADALSSVEYHLEAKLEDRTPPPSLLEVAEASLQRLGFGAGAADASQPRAADAEPTESFAAPPMGDPAIEVGADEGEETTVDEEIVLSAPDAPWEKDETAVGASAETVDAGDHESEPAPAPDSTPRAAPPLDDIDDDILEIFIEEAHEELGVIAEMLPNWKADAADQESLSRMRRSFHTLKGSGRLVGASDIGEVAWSVENLLNRLLDGAIQAGPAVHGFLDEAAAVLPRLVEALQSRASADIDVEAFIARGFAIAAGKDADAAPEADDTAQAQPDSQWQDDGAQEKMDPVLYDIFSKESAGHLTAIAEFLERCEANAGGCEITDGLIRSLHTLHGSARMAGADAIAGLAGGLEKYTKAVLSNDRPLTPEGVGALVESMALVKGLLASLNRADPAQPDHQALTERVRALYEAEHARAEERLRREQAGAGAASEPPPADQPSSEFGAEHDPELLAVFLEEGAEILESSERTMQQWRSATDNLEHVTALQRDLHTLKGGARMAGIAPIGDLSHGLESLLEAMAEGRAAVSPQAQAVVHRALDRLYVMLEQVQEQRPVKPEPQLMAEVDALLGGECDNADAAETTESGAIAAQPFEDRPVAPIDPEPPRPSAEVVAFPKPAPPTEAESAADTSPQRRQGQGHELVRVRAELLDHLVNHAGEVSIYRSRLEQNVGTFGFNLVELEQTVARLREQLRKLEIETEAQILYRYEQEGEGEQDFDPLEMDRYSHMQQLSRSLMESVADISSIQGMLDTVVRDSETLLLQQSRVNTDLQEGLMRTRMVPFTGLVSRMRRVVRQTSQELGKQAELQVTGERGEMDRTVLERIIAPLEHMLRNAVSHGIEAPQARRERSKPEGGTIRLSMDREGSEVVITVRDDGAGIDLAAIRRKAKERGLIDAGAELTDHEVMQFILEAGFSTATEVTQISGRGVGMDVVNSEIKQLGGSLQIDSVFGEGTTFTVRLPFTLAVNQALLVAVGDEVYALPLTSVEGIARITRKELAGYLDDPRSRYSYAGADYQVQAMGALLGTAHQLPDGPKIFPLLLVRSGDHRMALQTDALMGSREIVVKSVGPQLSTVRGLSGATILGDGRVVLILDAGALIRISAAARVVPLQLPQAQPEADRSGPATVMVVDDSITVRKVTSRLLTRNGLNAITAKDGVDAVALLQEHIPDVMLLDIEMPRMDGFELATHIRNEARLKHIPIIMITSRTGDKHRRRAMEIGVNRYLGKPYQESDLLENIEALLQECRDGS